MRLDAILWSHLLGNDVYKAAEGLTHPGNPPVKTRREMCVNGID